MVDYLLSKRRFIRSVRSFKLLAEFCDEDSKFSINVYPHSIIEGVVIKFDWLREHMKLGLLIITDFNMHEFIVTGKLTGLGQKLKEKLNVE